MPEEPAADLFSDQLLQAKCYFVAVTRSTEALTLSDVSTVIFRR